MCARFGVESPGVPSSAIRNNCVRNREADVSLDFVYLGASNKMTNS